MSYGTMINNWLRFLAVAVGLPVLLYFVNSVFLNDQINIWGETKMTSEGSILLMLWSIAMWKTFPDSAWDYDDEPTEISVRFIAFATGSPKRFYSDVSVRELPQTGTEIGLCDPDDATAKTVVGKVISVVSLSHKTDEGATQAVMIQVDITEIEKLDQIGWYTFE